MVYICRRKEKIAGTKFVIGGIRKGYKKAVREGIKTYHYYSGRAISVEAAVLRDIRTGISQTSGEMTKQSMIIRGASYCQTTAHQGARTGDGFRGHINWQGKQFYYSEVAVEPNTAKFPDFIKETGYGDIAGLDGANCRHSWSVFYPGISKPLYSDEELKAFKEATYTETLLDGATSELGAYNASQELRRLERGFRNWKRKEAVYEAGGDEDMARYSRTRAQEWSKRIKQFTESTGIRRQPGRERINKQ